STQSAQFEPASCGLSLNAASLGHGHPLGVEFAKGLSCFRQTLEQRRRLPAVSVLPVKRRNAVVDLLQTDPVGKEHRAASIAWESISVHVNHVDVSGAQRDSFIQHPRSLVDERVDRSLENLIVAQQFLANAGRGGHLVNQLDDIRIGDRLAIAVVAVPTLPCFLTEPPHLYELV